MQVLCGRKYWQQQLGYSKTNVVWANLEETKAHSYLKSVYICCLYLLPGEFPICKMNLLPQVHSSHDMKASHISPQIILFLHLTSYIGSQTTRALPINLWKQLIDFLWRIYLMSRWKIYFSHKKSSHIFLFQRVNSIQNDWLNLTIILAETDWKPCAVSWDIG